MTVCCVEPFPSPFQTSPVLSGDEAQRWITVAGPGLKRIELIVPEANCAACIADVETALQRLPGVSAARLNLTARRVSVTWRDGEIEPQGFIDELAAMGFNSRPFDPRETGVFQDGRESRFLLRALAVAGFAASNVMLLSVSIWTGADGATRDLFHWLSAFIALPAIAYAGRPFFMSAAAALRHGRTNMDVPISIGVLLASAMSLFETIEQREHAFFDAAITLLFFLLIGRYLDHLMRVRARSAVSLLMTLMPDTATIVVNGERRNVSTRDLRPEMTMAVAPGDRFSADGIVADGASDIDRSMVTGESAAETVGAGSAIQAGTLNLTGPLLVRVTAAGQDTFLAELIRLMAAAEQSQSAYVRMADRLARFYAPAVHLIAAATLVGWLALGLGWHDGLLAAVAVLIITCPCALGLAVPVVQVVASSLLFRRGIMIKNGSALERLAAVDTVVFDKTGTLTLGKPIMRALPAISAEHLGIALALADSSRHPLSRALAQALPPRGIVPRQVEDIVEHPGRGLSGSWRGVPVRLGNRSWCGVAEAASGADCLEINLRIGDSAAARFAFEDQLRPHAAETIRELRKAGLRVEILSGDRLAVVARAADALGIDFYAAAQLPAEKLAHVEKLRAAGRKVLVVGDGINDAPALAAGLVSMAPASASDIGRNAADIVFMGDSLSAVVEARVVACRTQQLARQNFILAVGYNVLAVPIAILGLATPLIAAVAMSSSSLLVIGNALRLGLTGLALPHRRPESRGFPARAAEPLRRAA